VTLERPSNDRYHPFSVIPTTLVDVLAINVTELYNKHDHLHRRLMAAATDRYKCGHWTPERLGKPPA